MSDVKYWKDKLNKIDQTSTKLTEASFDDDAIKKYYSDRGPTAAEKEAQANKFLSTKQNSSVSPKSTIVQPASLPPSNVTQGGATALSQSNATQGIGNPVKPKITVLPGETMDQAMARIKANAPTLVTPAEPNVWRDARNPRYAGLGQTQSKAYEPFDFLTRNPQSLPNQSIRQLTQRLGRTTGDEYTNVYFPADQPSGLASRGTTPAQDRAYISDLQSELQKTPNDPNLRGELARMQRFYPSAVKEASTNSDIGQFNPGADRLSSSRMPSKIGQFNPGADSLTGARMPTNVGKFNPGEDRTINPRMPSDVGQIRPGADRSAVVPSSVATASSTPRSNLRSLMPGRGGDEYTNVYGNTGPTSFQDQQYIKDLEAKVASDPNYEPWAAELWRMKTLRPNSVKETSMSSAAKKSTGPKFPGYMRGDDPASAARSKMVGSVEESVQHRATVLMNRYKNFKDGK